MKSFKNIDRLIILKKYNNRCAYCGCKLSIYDLTIDHIMPINRKNKYQKIDNNYTNLNPSCLSCNCSKHNMSIDEWRLYIENKHKKLLESEPSYALLNRFKLIKYKPHFKFYFEKCKNDNDGED